MNKTHKNQKGFTLVEGLLIILILAVIGFGGYYVWHTQHKTVATADATTSSKASSTPDTAIIKIPELGIEFTVPSALSDITYNYSANDPAGDTPVAGETFADLSTTTLNNLYSTCVANSSTDTAQGSALGMIVKGQGQGQSGEDFSVIKQFNGYYIAYANPQDACASPSSGTNQALSELSAFIQDMKRTTVSSIN